MDGALTSLRERSAGPKAAGDEVQAGLLGLRCQISASRWQCGSTQEPLAPPSPAAATLEVPKMST